MTYCECPRCGNYFEVPRPRAWLAIEPIGKTYKANAVNIAKCMYSEYLNAPEEFESSDGAKPQRSIWEFYRLPFFKFRQEIEDWYARERPMPEVDAELTAWKERKKQYFQSPEAKFAYGLNFCARAGSGYRPLKEVLTGRVRSSCLDDNGEFFPFSITDEAVLLKAEWQSIGTLKAEREDAFTYFDICSAVVARVLRLNVKGSEKCITLANCPISVYFPELAAEESSKVKKSISRQ